MRYSAKYVDMYDMYSQQFTYVIAQSKTFFLFTSVTPFLSGTSPPCVRRAQVFLIEGLLWLRLRLKFCELRFSVHTEPP